ncbi:MAG: LysR family transcriptional regulator [Myxococcota bacterium]
MRDPELIPLTVVFAAVVRQGGIRGAARALGVSKATVSRQLQTLEAALGLRLVERSTRRIRATEEGRALLGTLELVRERWDDGLAQLSATRHEAAGRLRVTAPELMVDGLISPAVRVVLERYPAIDVELLASDRMLDLVDQGIDVAIRTGRLADSSMHRLHLATTRERLVATPRLLEQLGGDDDLDPRQLPWVGHSALLVGPERELVHLDGRRIRVVPALRARSESSWAFLSMVSMGIGVGLLPMRFIQEQLDQGLLVALPWLGREVSIEAVYPAGRLAPPRVRRFLEVMREHLGGSAGGGS